jgi:hypothetical protein
VYRPPEVFVAEASWRKIETTPAPLWHNLHQLAVTAEVPEVVPEVADDSLALWSSSSVMK